MTDNKFDSQTTLVLTRRYPVPAARMFQIWTDPEIVRQWWSHSDWVAFVVEIDLRVGGAFKWGLDNKKDGSRFTAVGV